MKNQRNKKLGFKGEELASKYLLQQGLQIIEKNFTKRYGEIDLVCLDHNTLVFVEVKTRIGNKFGTPEEAITPWKLHSLVKSCQYYKLFHPDLPDALRIDVVTVFFKSAEEMDKINWYKNVTG